MVLALVGDSTMTSAVPPGAAPVRPRSLSPAALAQLALHGRRLGRACGRPFPPAPAFPVPSRLLGACFPAFTVRFGSCRHISSVTAWSSKGQNREVARNHAPGPISNPSPVLPASVLPGQLHDLGGNRLRGPRSASTGDGPGDRTAPAPPAASRIRWTGIHPGQQRTSLPFLAPACRGAGQALEIHDQAGGQRGLELSRLRSPTTPGHDHAGIRRPAPRSPRRAPSRGSGPRPPCRRSG